MGRKSNSCPPVGTIAKELPMEIKENPQKKLLQQLQSWGKWHEYIEEEIKEGDEDEIVENPWSTEIQYKRK